MMFTIPTRNYKMRLLTILAGVTILIWSSLEDSQVLGVTLLGWSLACFSIAQWIMSRYGGKSAQFSTVIRVSPLIGASIGVSASIITALLMLFKDIFHGHVYPDYPPQLILAVLERLPIWALAGGLIGVGLILLVCANIDRGKSNNSS